MSARSCMIAVVVLSGLFTTLPGAAVAQTVYRRTPGDTLKYDEVSRMVSTSKSPMGDLQTEMVMEGATSFRFRTADSLTVTLHPTKLTVTTPVGNMSPGTSGLEAMSFAMTMNARGDARLVSNPRLPTEVQALGNLASNFNDFFVRLPDHTLRAGLEWTDTLAFADSASGMRADVRRVTHYKVERDTVVDGRNAWVISSTGTSNTRTTGTVNQGRMDLGIDVNMTSDETGRTVFSRDGIMLSREIQATQSGTSRMATPLVPIELPISGALEISRRLAR